MKKVLFECFVYFCKVKKSQKFSKNQTSKKFLKTLTKNPQKFLTKSQKTKLPKISQN
jgi:hypothetical protein